MAEIVTLGETMLRLSPANVSTREEAQRFLLVQPSGCGPTGIGPFKETRQMSLSN